MRAQDLLKWGLTLPQLTAAPASNDPATARWAEAIHAQCRHVQGLVWSAKQYDPAAAYLLFGDRVTAEALVLQSTGDGQALLETVIPAGRRAGITITV